MAVKESVHHGDVSFVEEAALPLKKRKTRGISVYKMLEGGDSRAKHARHKNMDPCAHSTFLFPKRMMGPYDVSFAAGKPIEGGPTSLPSLCDLCHKEDVEWYFWDAGLARVLGIEEMHVYLCHACREIIMFSKTQRRCGKCEKIENSHRELYSVALADGKSHSKAYCVACFSEGAARDEIVDSLERCRHRRRCKSV
jgi:hypothetical protein